MKRWHVWLIIFTLFVTGMAPAQESKEAKSEKQATVTPVSDHYRLDFVLTEWEDGKKLNSREYSMMGIPNEWSRLRLGTRVPVNTATTQNVPNIQYVDVGLSLDCMVRIRDGNIVLETTADVSSFALPDQANGKAPNPIFRTRRSQVSAIATPGKPTLLSSIDDSTSQKRYKLEVTVTKMK